MKLGSLLADKGAITPDEKTHLQLRPLSAAQDWADRCVTILLRQAEEIERKKREQAEVAVSAKHRQRARAIWAATLGVIAVALCVSNWDNPFKLSPMNVRLIIFAVASLAGATGAMLWSALPFLHSSVKDVPDSVRGSWSLGLIIGCLAALIYVIAQEAGFPELAGTIPEEKIHEFKADYLAKLIAPALITALVAGMTLDRAFKALMKQRSPNE